MRLFMIMGDGNGGGSYSVYEIDENSGTVSGHSYDTLNENDVLNKRVLAVELLSGESFDVEASEDSQKIFWQIHMVRL